MSKNNLSKTNQIIEETEVIQVPNVEEKSTVVEESVVIGVVSNCLKLNVRKTPNAKAEVVSVVESGSELIVNKNQSTNDFYAVKVGKGNKAISGFCMKQFLTIRP